MKRTVLVLILMIMSASILQAQSRDVRRAERQLNRGNIEQAKEFILSAFEHEETKTDPEAWVIKAQIFMEIALAVEPEISQLSSNPVDIADEAMQMAQRYDTDNEHILAIQQGLLLLSEMIFNQGVEAYNASDWVSSSNYFLRAFEMGKDFGSVDTTTLYNAALSAELGQDYQRSIEMYQDLREMNYDQPYVYSSLANISLALGDTLQGTEYIQEGRRIYPDNLDLIFTEANIHIFTGDVPQARDVLALAIERDPDNPNLYFAFGANFDRMAQDTTYTSDERDFAFEQAIEAYENAIKLNPDYFDAVYNLGVLYFNKGIRIFEEADESLRQTHDFAQYEKDEERFLAVWLKAQPYLERSKDMIEEDDPNYRIVIISLVELYARTNQPEKLQELESIYRKYFGEEEE